MNFKTDADVSDRANNTSVVRWYAFGLGQLTGKAVRAVLLSV